MGWGDEIMASGQARVRHALTGRKVQMLDRYRHARWNVMWDGNPKMAGAGDVGEFDKIVNGPGARPYILEKRRERWIFNPHFRPDVGEIFLTEEERKFASPHRPQVVVEPNVKPKASPNKDWGWGRWQEFVRIAEGLELVQLGPAGTRTLDGVKLIETPSFRHACAVLANARAYVGHEGGLHHAAAALGIPGVVIFGGFISVQTTGYPFHRNLGVRFDKACGMRGPCRHCAAEMEKIKPKDVLKELEGAL